MNLKAFLTGLIVLAGCATRDAPPRVERVEVPVSVPCKVAMPERPTLPTDTLSLEASIWDQMIALRAERKELRGYVIRLEAAVQGCQ